jgi:DNA-binding Lrp family transcriptional regulator
LARRNSVTTKALVLIRAELGKAKEVAEEAAQLSAVQWAIVVTGPYDVVVAAMVEDNLALGTLVVDQIQEIDGVKDAITQVLTETYHGGYAPRGDEMFP